ncbi:MAG TPA: class I SAM-dependent methyltransferase [Candidatus Binataceae bacterium]|nr:class I SAM-dependent methyltransferase [Candidatus Binataceae bacterium]
MRELSTGCYDRAAMALVERSFYERQGAEALAMGREFDCSMESTNAAVSAMTQRYTDEFASVLDVGCGANLAYDLPLVAAGKRVVGVDFALNFLRLAPADRHGVDLAQADALRLPFRGNSFDAVICSETVEHVDDDRGAISEIARILKPAGLLFFTVPTLWSAARIIEMMKTRNLTIRLMEGHVREYSPRAVRKLLSPHFAIEAWYPVGCGWTGPVGKRIESLIQSGLLRRFSKSVAVVARKTR